MKEKETTLSEFEEHEEHDRRTYKHTKHGESTLTDKRQLFSERGNGRLLKPTLPSLTETTFEEWRMEVELCLKSGLYDEYVLRQAIRNSLTGNTRKILLTMRPSTTTREIIDKLENVYGDIKSGEAVLTEFYMSKQRKGEGVAEWEFV